MKHLVLSGTNSHLKERIRKQEPDAFHSQSTLRKKCLEYLHDCSRVREGF